MAEDFSSSNAFDRPPAATMPMRSSSSSPQGHPTSSSTMANEMISGAGSDFSSPTKTLQRGSASQMLQPSPMNGNENLGRDPTKLSNDDPHKNSQDATIRYETLSIAKLTDIFPGQVQSSSPNPSNSLLKYKFIRWSPAESKDGAKNGYAASETIPELWRQIFDRIKAHMNTSTKPPFSYAELTVMAIAVLGGEATTQIIIEWITATFNYYRDIVNAHLANDMLNLQRLEPHLTHRRSIKSKFLHLKRGMHRAMTDHDTPGHATAVQQHYIWRLPMNEARAYLALDKNNVLRQGSFRFLDLPSEVRQRIYGFVLLFDRSGIRYEINVPETFYSHRRTGPSQDRGTLHVLAKQDQRTFDFDQHWRQPSSNRIERKSRLVDEGYRYVPPRRPHSRSMLAITQVNKLIYREAISTFMGENLWYFSSVHALDSFLTSLPDSQKKYVEKVALVYDFDMISFGRNHVKNRAEMTFEALSELPRLKKLYIRIEQVPVSIFRGVLSVRSGLHPEKIPGFQHLVKMHDLEELHFAGSCDVIRDGMVSLRLQHAEKVKAVLTKDSEPSVAPKNTSNTKGAQTRTPGVKATHSQGDDATRNMPNDRYPRRSLKRVFYGEGEDEEGERKAKKRQNA